MKIRITGTGNVNVFGNSVSGQTTGSDLSCGCGNSTVWNDMTMTGSGTTATCGPCGVTVTT